MIVSTSSTLCLICYLPLISTTLIAIYKNAQFNPFDQYSIIYNFSLIESQNFCICRCFMNSMCKTVTYNGHGRYCVLYLAYLQEGQLQTMTIDANSSVISLSNIAFPVSSIPTTVATDTQSSTQVTSQAITTMIATSSLQTLSTMLSTMTSTTIYTTAVATCTTFITFDDIPYQSSISGSIALGYKNLNWTNVEYINVSTIPIPNGYTKGVRSQPFVIHNPTGDIVIITTANGTRFSFDNLYLTSAWRDSLNITMKTIRAGLITSTGIYTVMTSYPTYIYCTFCTNIDTITIQSSGGIPHYSFSQNGTQFTIDNLCISFGN